MVELTVRVLFAFQAGPQILLYGTRWQRGTKEIAAGEPKGPKGELPPHPGAKQVAAKKGKPGAGQDAQIHRNHIGSYVPFEAESSSYSKYFPHEKLFTPSLDRKQRLPVRINNHGFRGPDFEVEKEPGTTRVLILGASSTFGFHNRDDETYPHYLQEILDRNSSGKKFEVINFAIPHATSFNFVAMFLREGLALKPDIVTVYAGNNDAAIIIDEGPVAALSRAVRSKLLIAEFAHFLVSSQSLLAPELWSEEYAQRRARTFLENLDVLLEASREHGFQLIVLTQQARSLLVDGEDLSGTTYEDEQRLVKVEIPERRDRVAHEEVKNASFGTRDKVGFQRFFANWDAVRVFWIHSYLMDALKEWADQRGVPLVDIIEVLDERRDLVTCCVHLSPEGNQRIAAAIADAILAGAP